MKVILTQKNEYVILIHIVLTVLDETTSHFNIFVGLISRTVFLPFRRTTKSTLRKSTVGPTRYQEPMSKHRST